MKQIVFIEKNHAELLDVAEESLLPGKVKVRTIYTAISSGTERANLIGDKNVSGLRGNMYVPFPRFCGYSGSGIVESIGEGVTGLSTGDRVATYWGHHKQYNVLSRENVIKISSEAIMLEEAALAFIASFSLAAIRKCRIELGENCVVMGLGLLGLIAVQFARLSGAYPIIAVDLNEERRKLAQQLGADYVIDPKENNVNEQLSLYTKGDGANTIVEATGNGDALNTALRSASKFARVALLGCIRTPTTVDLYHDVHFPGVALIGAHTNARPGMESFPGYWTHADDMKTILQYLSQKRLNFQSLISQKSSPAQANEIYKRLAFDPNFPIGVLFQWDLLTN
ncbi:MAG: zinc-dependent alcohol dehydrogenase [Christensenellales bacterium]|jgi:threonine dehydrogenase-like Zn-dependent dehydrogenase